MDLKNCKKIWYNWKRGKVQRWNPSKRKYLHCAYLGSELKLDTSETHFNENLMATKHQELSQSFYTSDFPPAKTFYQGKSNHIGLLLTFVQYSNLTQDHVTLFFLSRALSYTRRSWLEFQNVFSLYRCTVAWL